MKKLLHILAFLFIHHIAAGQAKTPAVRFELKGIVTYYFNANQGNKPDVGAKAYIIKAATAKALGVDEKKVALYQLLYAEHALSVRAGTAPPPGEEDVKSELSTIDKQVAKMRSAIIAHPQTITVTADGSGVFTKKLAPGAYLVLIVSANRTHTTEAEALGQLSLEKSTIQDDDAEVSTNFDI